MKSLLKQVVPPFLLKALKPSSKYGWFGNFSSWSEAQDSCDGYDSDLIFDKVHKAAINVQKGKAEFERDGTLFFHEEYNWQLVSCLFMAAAEYGGVLHVTDFGGSLGSTYFQHKKILAFLHEVKWCVIEQAHFVDFGKKHLQSDKLIFNSDIAHCLRQMQPQVLILSSVLQYLEKPFDVSSTFLDFDYKYIFIDRTAFTRADKDEITIQKVNPNIYPASYPAWFFNEQNFLQFFSSKYELVASFENNDFTNKTNTYFKGFLLRKRNNEYCEN